jgi:catechol 2,3-dioxygenase-like lactoylglutathione lyase family enzyme
MTTTKAILTELRTVAVPVTDIDRAKATFEALGFEARFDAELQEGFRWVEVGAPGAGASLALIQAGPELPSGIDTGIRLTAPDARAAHQFVAGLGLDPGELLDWDTAPLMFSFTDHDGNRFYVSEAG